MPYCIIKYVFDHMKFEYWSSNIPGIIIEKCYHRDSPLDEWILKYEHRTTMSQYYDTIKMYKK